jgi:hypothetical protein
MRFVLDEVPKFCPSCGREIKHDKHGRNDFNAGCCFTCIKCNAEYQRAPKDKIADFARHHGDSGDYWR